MKRTILTEKPSVARDIASVLGVSEDNRAFIKGVGHDGYQYCITWCLGHLLEIHAPEDDGKWKAEKLPIIPKQFELLPIKSAKDPQPYVDKNGETVTPLSDREKRLQVIGKLFEWCDEIIAATDAGREGQGIFENVYNYIGIRKPVKRLWISSMEETAIIDGFNALQDNADEIFKNLGRAAWERAVADWLVGVNATRAITLATGYRDMSGKRKVMSLGRVQTPTLGMICRRYDEFVNFKSQPYWFIDGKSSVNGIEFRWRGKVRYEIKVEGVADCDKVAAGKFLVVEEVKTERKNEEPPLLYDLTTLQKAANSRCGYTMEQTAAAAQKLYESKLITYPRTGSRYISEGIFMTIPRLLGLMARHPEYGEAASQLAASGRLSRRSVNDGKLTDHHALIVTGRMPDKGTLSEVEEKVYDLIAARFLEAFSPISVSDVTQVLLKSGEVEFTAGGRKTISQGWRAISKLNEGMDDTSLDAVDDIELSMGQLPPLKEGDMIPIGTISLVEDKTKPRPLLTDATLLTAMQNAGKKSDDKQVVAALRDIGIGTPATRSEIVDTLVRRGYIIRKKKSILPTDLGLEVYHVMADSEIANVEMTARWEIALADILDGKLRPIEFEVEIRKYAVRITKEIFESDNVKKVREKMDALKLSCPKCGKEMRLGDKSAWCKACNYTVWRNIAGKNLGDETMRSLITSGHTSMLTGFKSKSGKTFDAMLELQEDGSVRFVFDKGKPKK